MKDRSDAPRILLCWGYYRAGWIEPFERLKAEFDFTYIFYRSEDEEEGRLTDEPVLYWDDYSDAYKLLDAARPDKIVFMSLTSGYPIALNLAAHRRGIPTYILQHGAFGTYADNRAFEVQYSTLRKTQGTGNSSTSTVRSTSMGFVARTLRPRDVLTIPKMAMFFLLLRRWGHNVACRYTRFRQRIPTGYICFSQRSAIIHRELDHARFDQIHLIGIPEYDRFFHAGTAPDDPVRENAPYYLLIDQPLAENRWGETPVTRQEMIRFFGKLNAYCKSRQHRLKIKLHPESYNCEWLPKDENMEWIKDADVAGLVRGAEGCFGTTSSLLLPAAVLKPLCLFEVMSSSLLADLSKRGLAVVLDFFGFEPQDIRFSSADNRSIACSSFVEDYLYKTDGRAVERLMEVLKAQRDNIQFTLSNRVLSE
jgi:hypothetical protein